jgi:hypothetical protein
MIEHKLISVAVLIFLIGTAMAYIRMLRPDGED